MRQEATITKLGWGVAVLGVVLAAIAGFLAIKESGKTSDWVETEGVVIAVETNDDDIDTIIRYRDSADEPYEMDSDYGTADSQRGEKVQVIYDPDNPTDAVLAGDSSGTSSHVMFIIAFGLLAAWGAAIALYDPKLDEITGRPGAATGSTIVLMLSSVIGALVLRNSFTGLGLLGMWLLAAAGIVMAYGLWRVIWWARYGAMAVVGVVMLLIVVAWAGNDNRMGAPLIWNLVLLAIIGLVTWSLTRKEVAATFARLRPRRPSAAA
jgi:hypothetical protein